MQKLQETQVRSLGEEDPLKEEMTTHSSILAWKKSHGQRSLVGYSPWGCKELDMTEQLTWREPKAQALSQASGSAVLYQGVLGPPHERRLCPTQAALVQSGTCTVSSVVRAWPGVNECVCVCVCTRVAFLDQAMLRRSC